jgi:hypothetical protein
MFLQLNYDWVPSGFAALGTFITAGATFMLWKATERLALNAEQTKENALYMVFLSERTRTREKTARVAIDIYRLYLGLGDIGVIQEAFWDWCSDTHITTFAKEEVTALRKRVSDTDTDRNVSDGDILPDCEFLFKVAISHKSEPRVSKQNIMKQIGRSLRDEVHSILNERLPMTQQAFLLWKCELNIDASPSKRRALKKD